MAKQPLVGAFVRGRSLDAPPVAPTLRQFTPTPGVSMRLLLVPAVLLTFVAVLFSMPASAASGDGTRASFIVVFKSSVSRAAPVAAEQAARHGGDIRFVYESALKGYAGVFPEARVAALLADDRVAYVEADSVMTISAQTLPWGIDKVDADQSSTVAGDGSGAISNVNVYVIDTGVDSNHADLSVVRHVNFAGGQNRDCHGHGTHVAGTIAAKDNASDVVGVAPGAAITGVKVLSCSGSGSTSGVIAGVDWVKTNAVKPAIANMSLGGSASTALDNAVKAAAGSGVFFALAAGNSGANACNSSPARAGAGTDNGIMTVAATDSSDREASWSNYGSCVDIWAPGVGILSTKRGGGTTTMSGTSMASPHVGGGGALYLSRTTNSSPAMVEQALKSAASVTSNKSKDNRTITRESVGGF